MNYDSASLGTPDVFSFFDSGTNTITHVVVDTETKKTAIIDSVLDYEINSAKISFFSADRIIHFIKRKKLKVEWILETHVHADHLSAAPYLQEKLGGKIGIGDKVQTVQEVFQKIFNYGAEFSCSGNQFDVLFAPDTKFSLGNISVQALHTPGHTPADMVYVFNDAAFVGDTLFMPDFGTARCDFPGGSAEKMYHSVQKIYELPEKTRLFLCHDYLPKNRTEYIWETTVKEQKETNIHLGKKQTKEAFLVMRQKRDAQLRMPRLMIPSIQVNLKAGQLPKPESNKVSYLKIPLNQF